MNEFPITLNGKFIKKNTYRLHIPGKAGMPPISPYITLLAL